MAEAAKRASALTTLVMGQVEVPVGLFTTMSKPSDLASFETAGPNGGVLQREEIAVTQALSSKDALPEGQGDPLGDDPGSEVPAGASTEAPSGGQLVPGEFRHRLIEQGSGQVVMPDEVRRGVRTEDGTFIDCTEHVRRIEEETKLEEMEIVSFIDVGQVERSRIVASYFIGAQEAEGIKPLRLIFEAMKLKRRAAVVKWSNRSRQSLGVMTAHKSGTLVLLKLVWAEDVRPAPAKALSIRNADVSPQEIDIAAKLVEAMGDTVESLDELRDDAIELRERVHMDAAAGKLEPLAAPEPEPERTGVDAWEASIAAVQAQS